MTEYRTLKEWDKAHQLTVDVYKLTQCFPESELLSLTQEIRLACADIPTKIAQGCEQEDLDEQVIFLQEAKDSAVRVEYYLLLSYELKLLNIADYDRLVSKVVEIKQMLTSYIHKLDPNF